jgi:hypothetical protein
MPCPRLLEMFLVENEADLARAEDVQRIVGKIGELVAAGKGTKAQDSSGNPTVKR